MSEQNVKQATLLTQLVTRDVLKILDGPPDEVKLHGALRFLSKWRSKIIENTLVTQNGYKVLSGPFKDMAYGKNVIEGAASARLLGCYEASLTPTIEKIIKKGYPQVLDVGCAEGYYAVGFATRMADTHVIAYDSNPKAQDACKALAKENNVADRVRVENTITHADFDQCQTAKTLVFCDIEGAEKELLDPDKAPGLKVADILVEVHDTMIPELSKAMKERFSKTHKITVIDRKIDMSSLPDWMEKVSDLDRLLAVWEWRGGPTPWLWMTSKKQP